MDVQELKSYKRDAALGAIGAFLMLIGDLCLSAISAVEGDSGLFARAAYFDGTYQTWRLPRRMFAFYPLVWQIVLVLIPDIRQALGAKISTWDFVLSQSSGNAALCVWMIANAVWAIGEIKRLQERVSGSWQRK